jgi:WD40 repeat protein
MKGQLTVQVGHFGGVVSVAFSSDGQWVLSGGTDGTLKLWDVSTARLSCLRQDLRCWPRADYDRYGVVVSEIRQRAIARRSRSLRIRGAGSEGEEGGAVAR